MSTKKKTTNTIASYFSKKSAKDKLTLRKHYTNPLNIFSFIRFVRIKYFPPLKIAKLSDTFGDSFLYVKEWSLLDDYSNGLQSNSVFHVWYNWYKFMYN